jgi:Zn finger protein HypA/HybF involved in hydrogenase expression
MFKSIIWSINRQEFENLVKNSDSIGQILKFFGLENKGGNSKTVQRRANYENIDISHIKLGINSNKGRKFGPRKTADEIFVENSTSKRNNIKNRIIKYDIIPYFCNICGIKDMWNNKKLVLQLDHINGNNKDNRINNLRFLCPNCHSQTTTFSGKKNIKFLELDSNQ